tara:strand:+ start:6592 stop:7431 length:840 start_codon:yes stop_codon:yes gene_type:complete
MYFPKSQITPNLHTNGNEFIYKTSKKNYIGHYYETSTGKFFTGIDPTQGPNLELIRPSSLSSNSQIGDLPTDDEPLTTSILHLEDGEESDGDRVIDVSPEYMKILGPEYNKSKPPIIRSLPTNKKFPFPTKINPNTGCYYRYFYKNLINNSYGETSKEEYKKLKSSPIFAKDLIEFKVLKFESDGERADIINKDLVNSLEKSLAWWGFYNFVFPDNPSQLGQYTSGYEFTYLDRTNYIGTYHIIDSIPYSGDMGDDNSVELLYCNKPNTPKSPSGGSGY